MLIAIAVHAITNASIKMTVATSPLVPWRPCSASSLAQPILLLSFWFCSALCSLTQLFTSPHQEPVLGEGGYVMPPRPFMEGLRKICDKYGILLILDEIQTGFGRYTCHDCCGSFAEKNTSHPNKRTGKYFALEQFPVTPDILIFAKAIASG